jgi:hypothetical protein
MDHDQQGLFQPALRRSGPDYAAERRRPEGILRISAQRGVLV